MIQPSWKPKSRVIQKLLITLFSVKSSVADPWHFGKFPGPLIRTSDKRIRLRILLFSSVTLKFFSYYFLKVNLHHFLKIKSHKDVAKQ